MATLSTTNLTLADWSKRIDPDGRIATIIEMLNQSNHMLDDMVFKEGNLPTGHRTIIRTGLPSVAWRLINKGTPKSKSTTAQVDEACGMLVARAELDVDIAEMNGDLGQARFSEAQAFMEAMNEEMQQTVIYGNSATQQEEFTGLAPRYSSLSAANGSNILSAGGAGSDNTSIWLVCWGDNTVHGIFPKGSQAGLTHEDLGKGDAFDVSNDRFRAYLDEWKWKCGIALKDWRYAVRIANVDISDLLALATTQAVTAATFLPKLMSRAIDRIPNFNMGKAAFYANRTIMSHLRIAAMEKSANVLAIQEGQNQFGQRIQNGLTFQGIPVRMVDQLLESEGVVA